MRRLLIALLICAAASARAAAPDYAITRTMPLGSPDHWDYLNYNQSLNRLFVAHGDEITVLDGGTGKVVGQLGPLEGAHGIVVLPGRDRVYADSGKAGTVSVFDLRTGKTVATIAARPDADAMAYDPATGRVFVIDGDSGTVTAIDAATDQVLATIPLGGSLESAVTDGSGHLFVNLAEHRAVARIDARALRVTARWPIPDCVSPHGMAYDEATRRVFTSCIDGHLQVLDAADGHVVARLPIGHGSDALAIDEARRRVFSSNYDGTLSVIGIRGSDRFAPTVEIRTEPGARTVAVDPSTGRLFTVTADIAGTEPSRYPGVPRYRFRPGTLHLLIIEPRGPA